MKPKPPADLDAPFREADAKIARRVVAGELTIERAEEIAAGGRLLAFTREYRATIRKREAIEKEILRLGAVRRSIEAAEVVLAEIVERWSKLHADRAHRVREADAAATRREERAARGREADDARRALGLPTVGPIDRDDNPNNW